MVLPRKRPRCPYIRPHFARKGIKFKLENGWDPSFTASSGWLTQWKECHGIRQLIVTGEILSADIKASDMYKISFEKFVSDKNLSPSQVYNADETGLFYKMMPKTSLASKLDEKAKGHKKSKDCVTLLCCSNATSEHKLPLMLIGKSAKARALKNISVNCLPVLYRSQKKSLDVSGFI